MKKLSYSQITKYNTCPRSYKLHYKDRLREKTVTSYLSFGSAVDKALNAVLKDFKDNKSVTVDYKSAFDKEWQTITIHGEAHNLMESPLVGYAKNDFVADLLTPEDLDIIKTKTLQYQVELKDMTPKELRDHLENRRSQRAYIHFKPEEQILLNVLNWLSLKRKAHLMLDAYVRDIVPKFEEVKDYQCKVELIAEEKGFVGYIDAIVKFKGENEYTVIDNKTSGSIYEADDLVYSQQLAIYCFTLGIKRAGYAVMLKNIKMNKERTCSQCNYRAEGKHVTCNQKIQGKRCGGEWIETIAPEGQTQLLVDNISLDKQGMIVDNIGEVNDAIEANIFPQNLSACSNIYGQPCIYRSYCWEGKKDNLIELGEDDDTQKR